MIPGLEPFTSNGVGFLAIASGLTIVAWFCHPKVFVHVLAISGVIMAFSWLRPNDLLAMLAFQIAPFFSIRWLWGKKGVSTGLIVVCFISIQVLLFLIFKRYAWFDAFGALDIPISIIGISYILFRQIHLLIEAPYLGHHPFNTIRYLAFTLSPLTLIAGPIQRYDGFCSGLDKIGRPDKEDALAALHRSVNGLIKAFVLAPLFLGSTNVKLLSQPTADWLDFFIVFYSFPVYLYLNFSGYVDIMIGVANLCGFTSLPENFNRPYLARNVRDFWTRWHITLGIWVRHYVFTPLSTALVKRSNPAWHGAMMAVAVMAAFFLIGVWHGPTSNFIVFGLLQGTGVVISASFESMLRRTIGKNQLKSLDDHILFHAASIFVTFNFTCLTFLLLDNSLEDVVLSLGTFLF